MIKLSIVIPILNSHEVVARQAKYFNSLGLPPDVEIIFVDDGSDPPLNKEDYILPSLRILYTNDKRPWTQGLARNMGAKHATGEILLMTDIDHILSRDAIDASRAFTGHKMIFPRHIAVLGPEGNLTQDLGILYEYGMDMTRYKRRGFYASVHGNTWAMPRSLFWELGGYPPGACQYGFHAPRGKGEDCFFNRIWNRWAAPKGIKSVLGPKIYMFPNGRYHVKKDTNPLSLFHGLSYEPVTQEP